MLQNKAEFSFFELAGIFGETHLINVKNETSYVGISTDSREIVPGNIFIALKGDTFDGHDKVGDAFDAGAKLCVVEKGWFKSNASQFEGKSFLVLSNPLFALHKLANHHRRKFSIPVIAVAGSNGKTTTKEMTAHLLSQKFNILKTFENFNNQIGVPLMLLSLTESFEAAVLEMGTNEPGEINILTSVMEPDFGVITNIGKEHLEKLIDLDGVEMEETFLFGYLYKNNGMAFVNNDDERLRKYVSFLNRKFAFGQAPDSDLRAEIKLSSELMPELRLFFNDQEITVIMQTTGTTSALNALAASAVAVNLGMNLEEIKTGLENFVMNVGHGYGRMKLEKAGDYNIINDCYNANPDSMHAALNALSELKTNSAKFAVLGDMRELGESSVSEHKSIIESASAVANKVFLFGDIMHEALNLTGQFSNVFHFGSKEQLADSLFQSLNAGDYLLVKGSRGTKMEIVIELLKQKTETI